MMITLPVGVNRASISLGSCRQPSFAQLKGRSRPVRHCSVAVSNSLVLVPVGDGSCNHLENEIPMPAEIKLKEGLLELGREEPADIVLSIPTVSTRHAMLKTTGNKVVITDLNSTNGTWVNDEELTPMKAAELTVGGEVIFGDMFLAKFALEQRDDDVVDVQSEE